MHIDLKRVPQWPRADRNIKGRAESGERAEKSLTLDKSVILWCVSSKHQTLILCNQTSTPAAI